MATLNFWVKKFSFLLIFQKTLAKIYSHVPAGFSLKTIRHYLQFSTRKKFEMYDYGEVKNLKIYGDPNPPLYNLSKLTCPTALYYSTGDSLVPPEVRVLGPEIKINSM